MSTQILITKKSQLSAGFFTRLCHGLAVGYERMRQRRALMMLSESQLKDIGLTRHDVADETAKPFWKV